LGYGVATQYSQGRAKADNDVPFRKSI